MKIATSVKARIESKKIHPVLVFNQSQWLKLYVKFNTKKNNRSSKNGNKDRKTLYKLMNHAGYGKTMENLWNRIDAKLISNKKEHLKWTSKQSYMSQKNIWQWIFDKISMYEFHYDYIKNKYGNK